MTSPASLPQECSDETIKPDLASLLIEARDLLKAGDLGRMQSRLFSYYVGRKSQHSPYLWYRLEDEIWHAIEGDEYRNLIKRHVTALSPRSKPLHPILAAPVRPYV